jgi:3-hydroxyacyl-CoA dehydrogenase
VLAKGLAYTARRVGEISDDVAAIDDAMRWGYNWELGPFETWDALGFAATYDRMVADGLALPASVTMREKGIARFYREDGAVWDLAKGEYVARATDPRTLPYAACARARRCSRTRARRSTTSATAARR